MNEALPRSIWFKSELLPFLDFKGKLIESSDSHGVIFDKDSQGYYHGASDEEIYKLFQKLIEIKLPFMLLLDICYEENYAELNIIIRLHGESIYNYIGYEFPKLNEKEEEIFKFYKVMNNV